MEEVRLSIEEIEAFKSPPFICPKTDCRATFGSESNRNLHVAQVHKDPNYKKQLEKKGERLYYCPLISCVYNSVMHFTSIKYLRQHYRKVHTIKTLRCDQCQKTFSTEGFLQSHRKYCGIIFKCAGCDASYPVYESLSTHARRKGHFIFPRANYQALFNGNQLACTKITLVGNAVGHKGPILLPKDMVLPSDLVKIETTNDTMSDNLYDEFNPIKEEPIEHGYSLKRKRNGNIAETETQTKKAVCSSAGTQTEVVSVNIKPSIASEKMDKKSANTQTATATVTSSTRACNTSLELQMAEFEFNDVERTSFGTQTTLSPSILLGAESMVKAKFSSDDAPREEFDTFCTNIEMETQTDWFTDLDSIGDSVYSNTYTQTCDDILPPALRFNNTHTQTMLGDLIRSVGSQTHALRALPSSMLMNNETQTEEIFKELLEEINS